MAEEFTPITTQEQLDGIIRARLERERAKYSDYDTLKSSLEEKTRHEKELEDSVRDLTGKLSKAETDSVKTRIAHELGLPAEVSARLNGSNEEEIRRDAEELKGLFAPKKGMPPFKAEPKDSGKDDDMAAFRQMAKELNI